MYQLNLLHMKTAILLCFGIFGRRDNDKFIRVFDSQRGQTRRYRHFRPRKLPKHYRRHSVCLLLPPACVFTFALSRSVSVQDFSGPRAMPARLMTHHSGPISLVTHFTVFFVDDDNGVCRLNGKKK